MRSLLAVSSFALIAACASSTVETDPVAVDTPVAEQPVMPSPFDLAMQTVAQLEAAGNEQQAIDRIQQLLGNPDLTDTESASALLKLGQLRFGAGSDVTGAISAWNELIEDYPDTPAAFDATPLLATAQSEYDALTGALARGELSPTQEFEARFRLGEHQSAADLMLTNNLSPDNAYLVDMFQIGYLCDDPNLTGPSYDMTEPDGTARTVRFCEFGK